MNSLDQRELLDKFEYTTGTFQALMSQQEFLEYKLVIGCKQRKSLIQQWAAECPGVYVSKNPEGIITIDGITPEQRKEIQAINIELNNIRYMRKQLEIQLSVWYN